MESFPIPGWEPVRVSKTKDKTFFLYTMPPEKTADYVTAISNSNLEPFDENFDYCGGLDFTTFNL